MGITLVSLPDGRVQLLHTPAAAASQRDGREGLLFMQEMVELSRMAQEQQQAQQDQVRGKATFRFFNKKF